MVKVLLLAGAALAMAACNSSARTEQDNATIAAHPGAGAPLSLARLDCGSGLIKNFDKFFSDRPGLYPPGSRKITDSCYLIRHGDQVLLWDTGFKPELKGKSQDMGDLVVSLDTTIPDQLAAARLTPADVDIVGISHMHADHTGQASLFPTARLLIGKADFALTNDKDDPFGPWRGAGKPVTLATGDIDIFGDGSVLALHLPGHTPDHLALLVKLASGPVLLTGDLYHATDARAKRGVPPFNTSREQTLASMDKFEALAKKLNAKVVIQHEPADITKLPAFPAEAR